MGRAVAEHEMNAAIDLLLTRREIVQEMRGQRTLALAGTTDAPAISPGDANLSEAELMQHLGNWLRERFTADLEGHRAEVVDTSIRGRPTGQWTRPDFTVAAVRSWRFTNVRAVELHGFELKAHNRLNISAVHEAYAHMRQVNFAYAVGFALGDEGGRAVRDECNRLGVGLVEFTVPDDLQTWTVRIEARRSEARAEAVELFITKRLTSDVQRRLEGWVHAPE
jgi:hypothetical protein